MKQLKVELGDKSYPIYIGENLLQQSELVIPFVKGKQVLIVTNTTVAPLYLEQTKKIFADFEVQEIILKDGEQYKTLDTVNQIWTKLLESHFDRTCTLVALGGGVVGDMTGFAAASYQRGVNFIQIPTTLLSQVDSSVGGKTGVNHSLAKNMIGAFYQPKCVLIDTNTLKTLANREFSAGMAEVIKYGLIDDLNFFEFLESRIDNIIKQEQKYITEIIYRSCQSKAKIVAEDEFESGKRALLNLGHTFGHAIENALGYGIYLHGEAVAVGMLMAAHLSNLDKDGIDRIKNLLIKANLPTTINQKTTEKELRQTMLIDKKNIDNNIHFILLKSIGYAFITSDYNDNELSEILNQFIEPL